MPQYQPNSPATIKEVFSLEGEYLRKAGFTEPDLSTEPEDYHGKFVVASEVKVQEGEQ